MTKEILVLIIIFKCGRQEDLFGVIKKKIYGTREELKKNKKNSLRGEKDAINANGAMHSTRNEKRKLWIEI